MLNTLTHYYEAALQRHEFLPDPAQAEVIRELERCANALLRPATLTERLKLKKLAPVPGIYLWGGVGRGKTKLMDLFFEYLPLPQKRREHFHAFMRNTHLELAKLQGKENPLALVAKALAKTTRVLCLDEFFVEDIGDAMILGNLLAALLDNGLTLIITSNIPPQALYANGLQRSQFLPAIALIEHHCVVHELVAGQDYRRRPLTAHDLWLPCQHEGSADPSLRQYWRHETGVAVSEPVWLDVNHRRIKTVAVRPGIIWFRFADLCSPPRSQQDYLVLAEHYHTLILSDVPVMTAQENNAITYFIFLVDILYDANVRLIVAAADNPLELYQDGRLIVPYQRTLSRLTEMQSLEYQEQHREHRGDTL